MSKQKPRLTESARRGLRSMVAYWLACQDSFGEDFEDLPETEKEARDIGAALAWLGFPNKVGIKEKEVGQDEDKDEG